MQVLARSPTTITCEMPCCLSSKSRSLCAKPLEDQCSCTTMSVPLGAKSGCHSPPHVSLAKVLRVISRRCVGLGWHHRLPRRAEDSSDAPGAVAGGRAQDAAAQPHHATSDRHGGRRHL